MAAIPRTNTVQSESKAGAAAGMGFSIGCPLALAAMFWGLNLVPDILAVPAVISCLALPFVSSWLFYWVAMRLLT
jgi:hypothetical protein